MPKNRKIRDDPPPTLHKSIKCHNTHHLLRGRRLGVATRTKAPHCPNPNQSCSTSLLSAQHTAPGRHQIPPGSGPPSRRSNQIDFRIDRKRSSWIDGFSTRVVFVQVATQTRVRQWPCLLTDSKERKPPDVNRLENGPIARSFCFVWINLVSFSLVTTRPTMLFLVVLFWPSLACPILTWHVAN